MAVGFFLDTLMEKFHKKINTNLEDNHDIHDVLKAPVHKERKDGGYELHMNSINRKNDIGKLRTVVDEAKLDSKAITEIRIGDKIAFLHDMADYLVSKRPKNKLQIARGRTNVTYNTTGTGERTGMTEPILGHEDKTKEKKVRGMIGVIGSVNYTNRDETAESTTLARKLNLPIWSGQSLTAARMMTLATWVGANTEEMTALALGLSAFWRTDYDHREAYGPHTLHEVMDIASNFGVPYKMLKNKMEVGYVTYESYLSSAKTRLMIIDAGMISLTKSIQKLAKSDSKQSGKLPELERLRDLIVGLNKILEKTEPGKAPLRQVVPIPKTSAGSSAPALDPSAISLTTGVVSSDKKDEPTKIVGSTPGLSLTSGSETKSVVTSTAEESKAPSRIQLPYETMRSVHDDLEKAESIYETLQGVAEQNTCCVIS
jgi:hypothetical protein